MVAWSSIALKNIARTGVFRGVIAGSKNASNKGVINYVPSRKSGDHREMVIRASRYQYIKFKDLLVFYLLLGAIPLGLIIAYTNLYIGPAKLAAIPEGYEPKPWEYYSHPITRFFARYVNPSPQESYERTLHHVFIDSENMRYVLTMPRMLNPVCLQEALDWDPVPMFWIRQLERKINKLMASRSDYQAWYFIDPQAKFVRTQVDVHQKSIEKSAGHAGTGFFF